MRGVTSVLLTIVGILIGALLVVFWQGNDGAVDALDGRAVGLQAGVLAGEAATVKWPSWTPEPTNTPRFYPSWTPVPTNTPRVYPSWTPLPSRTPRATATWPAPPTPPPAATPTPQDKPCEAPWPFTYNEAQTIAAAARNHLWLGTREEPQGPAQEDALLSIGLYELDLGAPLTDEYHLEADDGGRIRCRGFALGIVALRDGAPSECRNWAIVTWGGDATEQ